MVDNNSKRSSNRRGGGFCLFESVLGCRLSFPLPLSSSVFSSLLCSPTDMFLCSEARLKYSSQRPIFAIVPVSERVTGTKEQKLDGIQCRTHTLGRDHLMVGVVCLHHRLTMDAIIHCKNTDCHLGSCNGRRNPHRMFRSLAAPTVTNGPKSARRVSPYSSTAHLSAATLQHCRILQPHGGHSDTNTNACFI